MWLEVGSGKAALSRLTHQRVTQTVGLSPSGIEKSMMKKLLIILVFVTALVFFILKDYASITFVSQVCGKSCWNNIIVGETNKQEFLKIVSALPNVNQGSITSYMTNGGLFDEVISFQFYRNLAQKDSLVTVSARTKNQKVVFMTFQGELGATFQTIFDAFREPDSVSSLWVFDGGINTHFINSVQGIEIIQYFDSEKSTIQADTEVMNLSLFDPNQYSTYLGSDLLTGDYKGVIMYPWKGYGKIEDLYWPPR